MSLELELTRFHGQVELLHGAVGTANLLNRESEL